MIDSSHRSKAHNHPSISSLRPHTRAAMINLMKVILRPTHDDANGGTTLSTATTLIPLEELDLSQSILLRWSADITVPWAWSVWDDERILDYGIIELLVSPSYSVDRAQVIRLMVSVDYNVVVSSG